MLKRISTHSIILILSIVVGLAATPLSFADGNSFTVNVPNSQGGYTAVVIQQSGSGFVGPQGEYYSQFPTVSYLQTVYGGISPNAVLVTDDNAPSSAKITIAPPALPVYVQPAPPDPSYIWMPGYWAYGTFGYYWVPGTWVAAPTPGYLWTPGYWGWNNGVYVFNQGYWGRHIGFYGGINYGWGYGGHGFVGGGWSGGVFVNYGWHKGGGGWQRTSGYGNNQFGNNTTNKNSSFNGGPGGTNDKPTAGERAAAHERHLPPTAQQSHHMQLASKNPSLRASVNHGKPAVAATTKPGVFHGKGVVAVQRRQIQLHNKALPQGHPKVKPRPKLKPKPVPPPNV